MGREKNIIKLDSVSAALCSRIYIYINTHNRATAVGEVKQQQQGGIITIIKIKRAAPIWQFVVANGSLVEKQANSIFQIKSRPMIYGRLRRCIWRRVTNLAKVDSKRAQMFCRLTRVHTHSSQIVNNIIIAHNITRRYSEISPLVKNDV